MGRRDRSADDRRMNGRGLGTAGNIDPYELHHSKSSIRTRRHWILEISTAARRAGACNMPQSLPWNDGISSARWNRTTSELAVTGGKKWAIDCTLTSPSPGLLLKIADILTRHILARRRSALPSPFPSPLLELLLSLLLMTEAFVSSHFKRQEGYRVGATGQWKLHAGLRERDVQMQTSCLR
jgi:hypothetical protein